MHCLHSYTKKSCLADWRPGSSVLIAEFWAGEEAAISHRAAAAAYGLDGVEPGVVELTTTGHKSQVPPGIILHRTTILTPSETAWLEPLSVTTIPSTLIDLHA